MANPNKPLLSQAWWSISPDEIVKQLAIDPTQGLTERQAKEKQEQYGSNTLQEGGPSGLWPLFVESIKSPMMILLLTVATISLLLGQYREAVVMVFVVLMYVGVELLNKARSDKTMSKLRELQASTTTVLRDGQLREIPLQDVTVGDILPLQPGSIVAADARLLESSGLLVNEASLTGESAPVKKDALASVAQDAPLAERPTAVFAGTTILDGQGKGIVVAVGKTSEFGKIAQLSSTAVSEQTPLQKEMRDLAKTLAVVAISISFLIPLMGLLLGYSLQQMLLTWLALTFLMVPGQPPIIITMALALASFELAQKKVIVKKLQGAETLGSVTLIISDKTGTMTENRMALKGILLGDGSWATVEGGKDEIWRDFMSKALPALPEATNDPTDKAILETASTKGLSSLREAGRLVNQVGFVTAKIYRSMEYAHDSGFRLYVSGSPEFILEHSTAWERNGERASWNQSEKEGLKAKVQELAKEGKRVTAYGYREQTSEGVTPDELTFVGCAVIEDPVRLEVKNALEQLKTAGVRTVMVTGDSPDTAGFVASQVGLDTAGILTGSELEHLNDDRLQSTLEKTHVFARITPEQKLRLVKVGQQAGNIVAVTGDGVNDAPALKTANIGIAMGITGTDVAKEAASLVLTDDNFAHLPDGVAIGRKAYDNFHKGITYYLSAKAILLAIFVVPLIFRLPFPLAPIQIIFTELLMDLASSTIFVSEEAEKDVMKRQPRRLERFLSRKVGFKILQSMIGPTIAILAAYLVSLWLGYSPESARTAAFSTWLLGHILLALNLKQEHLPLLKQGLLSNRFGVGWLVGMILLVLGMTFVPSVQSVMSTTSLSGIQWVLVITGAILGSAWIEVRKLLFNGRIATKQGGTVQWT